MLEICHMTTPRDVLNFWFGEPDDPYYGSSRPEWFVRNDDFDAAIRERFGDAVETALNGGFEKWRDDFAGALSLTILLDQFPRNIYRGTAKMFAGDLRSRTVVARALEYALDTPLSPCQRLFLYLPFEHSEEPQDQIFCIQLFEAMPNVPEKGQWLEYARKHKEIIDRFGRFPHRNEVLGRPSTPEEIEFLKQPGSGF
jgi:uncharacterized protein (DUF924 family)